MAFPNIATLMLPVTTIKGEGFYVEPFLIRPSPLEYVVENVKGIEIAIFIGHKIFIIQAVFLIFSPHRCSAVLVPRAARFMINLILTIF